MGAAVATLVTDLGGDVTVLDIAKVTGAASRVIPVDLRDQISVDAALDEITEPIDSLFSCAGVADGDDGLIEINFVAQRHIIERMVIEGVLGIGSTIGIVSSMAGIGWHLQLPRLLEFLATPDWDAAVKWVERNEGVASYRFSKQAMNAYVALRAMSMLEQGIRINSVDPSMTDTPLARANAERWFRFGADYRAAVGLEPLLPIQLAYPLAFLCSAAADGITGTSLLVDQGLAASALTGVFDTPGTKRRYGLAEDTQP